ncbi:hypothetical protein PROFUN_14036 [Planoprotostelium fungivorum]|uniref:MYCBP-associated protein n=1 Tax=Planoprotostelium fungivorum TaxID=1890364 RepID=A0A2P6N2A2_9EUKA|nr:hypothetical protein PROFUN_14036 [Planoprotostelium fungivorum]
MREVAEVLQMRAEITDHIVMDPGLSEVPMSVLLTKSMEPRRDGDGNYLSRSMLGQPTDYQDMKSSIVGKTDDDLRYEGQSYSREQTQQEEFLKKIERKKKKEERERAKNLQSMQVFMKTQFLRQERALERWNKMLSEWDDIKTDLMLKSNKNRASDLVIARSEEFRYVKESRDIAEQKIRTSKGRPLDDLWTSFEPIGNPSRGIFSFKKQPTDEPVEIIRNPKLARPTTGDAIRHELLAHQMKPSLGTMDVQGLEIVGRGLQVTLSASSTRQGTVQSSLGSYGVREDESFLSEGEGELFISEDMDQCSPSSKGPAAAFDRNDIFMEVELNRLKKERVVLKNTGTTAVYYSWNQIEKESFFSIPKDDIRRFYFDQHNGVILPGQEIYNQSWRLTTRPTLTNMNELIINVKAVAIRRDEFTAERESLEQRLAQREIVAGVQSIIEDVFNRTLDARSRKDKIVEEVLEITAFNNEERQREQLATQNTEIQLFYSPHLYSSIVDLASKITSTPTVSVLTLGQLIQKVEDINVQAHLYEELNEIVSRGSVPPPPSVEPTFMKRIANALLLELVFGIPDLSRRERDRLKLPPKRFLVSHEEEGVATQHMEEKEQEVGTQDGVSVKDRDRSTASNRRRRAKRGNHASSTLLLTTSTTQLQKLESIRKIVPPTHEESVQSVENSAEDKRLDGEYRKNIYGAIRGVVADMLIRFEFLTQHLPKKIIQKKETIVKTEQTETKDEPVQETTEENKADTDEEAEKKEEENAKKRGRRRMARKTGGQRKTNEESIRSFECFLCQDGFEIKSRRSFLYTTPELSWLSRFDRMLAKRQINVHYRHGFGSLAVVGELRAQALRCRIDPFDTQNKTVHQGQSQERWGSLADERRLTVEQELVHHIYPIRDIEPADLSASGLKRHYYHRNGQMMTAAQVAVFDRPPVVLNSLK